MADKAQQLLVEALTHAATEPHGVPLYAQKNDAGLFPTTTLVKTDLNGKLRKNVPVANHHGDL